MTDTSLTVRRATMIGALAVLMWATLALLTTFAGPIPPFQLTGLAFAVGGSIGLAFVVLTGRTARLRQPPKIWALGIAALFGFHLLFFIAIRRAPPVEANLVNYLWPLLIVVFSALLPGERLRWWHLAGALAGLAGAIILIAGRGDGTPIEPGHLVGYGAALASALIWAGYSVLSRRLGAVPTEAVAGFCLGTAALALLAHTLAEDWVTPDAVGWLAVLGLGIGPVGLAFYVWDFGLKRGDIRALGAFAYMAPLLSTLVLIAAGRGEASWSVVLACILIVGGALLAGRDLLVRTR